MSFRNLLLKALSEKYPQNPLEKEAREIAVVETTDSVVELIKTKITEDSDSAAHVKDLLTGETLKENPVFHETKEIVAEVLQNNGIPPQEAKVEARKVARRVIYRIADRVESSAPEHSHINLETIFKLAPNGEEILNELKD